MGDKNANVVTKGGDVGSVTPAELARSRATGSHTMTDEELAAFKNERQHANDFWETKQAELVGKGRGLGEAVGFPVDETAVDVADLFDQGPAAREYFARLKEHHPYASGMGELSGQAAGAMGLGELLGGGAAPQRAGSALGRIAHGAGEGALRGGLENLIAGSTQDVNEAALGDHVANGEKLVAKDAKHFLFGAVGGGLLGGGASALGELASGAARRGAPALEDAATGLVGREMGAQGADRMALGRQAREAVGGGVPGSRSQIADYFAGQQSAYREDAQRSADRLGEMGRVGHESRMSDLADAHVAGAGDLTATQEARRWKSDEVVQGALDTLAERHAAARDALAAERAKAVDAAEALAAQRAKNAEQLESLAKNLDRVKGVEKPRTVAIVTAAREAIPPEVADAPVRFDPQLGINPDAGLEGASKWKPNALEIGEAKVGLSAKAFRPKGEFPSTEKGSMFERRGARISVDPNAGLHETPEAERAFQFGAASPTGVEKPNTKNVFGAAREAVYASGAHDPSTAFMRTPATQTGLKTLDNWLVGLQKAFPDGEVSFVKMGEVIGSVERLAKSTKDPIAKKVFQSITEAARAEFDRASEATANGISEAASLNAARLRSMAPELEAAHDAALADVASHDKLLADFDKTASKEVQQANELAAAARGDFEKAAKAERGALGKSQKEATEAAKGEAPKAPVASKETPHDAAVAAIKAKDAAPAPPLISPTAAMGALFSLAHGNIATAAMTAGGSLVAGQVKARGNLLGARILHAVAEKLTAMDQMIARGATWAVKRPLASALGAMARAIPDVGEEKSTRGPTYEKVVAQVRETQANPGILELRVRQQFGGMAESAPQLFGSTLASAQRIQNFLAAAIPPERVDPFSPTAHLEESNVSDAEKYDFMQYVGVARDPTVVLKGVADGTVTSQQVAALEAFYPTIYKQMCTEVDRERSALRKPMEYENAVHIGTLLDIPTSEVMVPSFQTQQAQMFAERAKSESIQTGSPAPSGPNGRMSKNTMSGSQQIESGGD